MRLSQWVLANVALMASAAILRGQTSPPTSPPTPPPVPAAQPDALRVDGMVAAVGSKLITWFDIKDRLIQREQEAQRRGVPPRSLSPAETRAQIDSVLMELVDEELLLAKAEDMDIEIPESQIIPTVSADLRRAREGFATDADFSAALGQAGFASIDEFRRSRNDGYRRMLTFQQVQQKLMAENKIIPVNVTDEELEREFTALKGTLGKRPASITWRQMVIPPTPKAEAKARARAKAESLHAELKAGGDFDRIARRESMDSSTRALGGDRGWARRGQWETQFDAIAFGTPVTAPMKPGEISRPVETPVGIHIYRIDRVQPGEVKSRHIFIRPAIDSGDVADLARRADSVAAAIRGGTPFDSLTKKYHDYAGREDAGLIPFIRDSLPLGYQAAFANKKVGDVVTFTVPGIADNIPKYVVAQVTLIDEGGDLTLDQIRTNLRQELARQGGMRRFLDRLRREYHVVTHPERAYVFAGVPR